MTLHHHGTLLPSCDVAILTALTVEFLAVREHLTNIAEYVHDRGTIYDVGRFDTTARSWQVVLAQIGMGNPRAALEAERVMEACRPEVLLFVGVAGGLKKDVGLGDVVASSKVYGYESGKELQDFAPRPEAANTSYRLEQRARKEAASGEWVTRIKPSDKKRNDMSPLCNPIAVVGAIATGEKVVASRKSKTFKLIQSYYSDALAVEMEGGGLLAAARANGAEGLVVRGISDLVSGKSRTDADGYQELASRHASAFAFQILAQLGSAAVAARRMNPEDAEQLRTAAKALNADLMERCVQSLLKRYGPRCVFREVRRQFEASPADIPLKAGLCCLLCHLSDDEAATFLASLLDNTDEHQLVRIEARRALDAYN